MPPAHPAANGPAAAVSCPPISSDTREYPINPTPVKLDPVLKGRLKRVITRTPSGAGPADARAMAQCVDREQKRRVLRQGTETAWEEFEQTDCTSRATRVGVAGDLGHDAGGIVVKTVDCCASAAHGGSACGGFTG